MAYRGRLLMVGALSALLLACQAASAAPARPATQSSSQSGQPGQAVAAKPATSAKSGSSQQADPGVPRIKLEPLSFGFRQPLYLTHAGDGSGRQFVVEKGGAIRVIKSGQLLPTPFLDITARILASGSEQGLLGLAFHPR